MGEAREDLLRLCEHVGIAAVEPVGQYAVRIVFDDGHDTGLYSWDYLYDLGANQPARWQRYLERLAAAGHPRADAKSP